MSPTKHTNKHLQEQRPNYNPYVKLTQLTQEDIEEYTGIKQKKENTSNLSNECIPLGTIKQEYQDDPNLEFYETTVEHTLWQSSVQEINVKIESTNLIEVKTEPVDLTEDTSFSNYAENAHNNGFICKECFAYFDNFEEFVIHKNLSHSRKPYVCDICNAKFVLSAHLNLHLVEHVNYLCMRNSSISPSEMQSSSQSNLMITPSGNYKNSRSTTALAKNSCNTNTSVDLQQNVSNNSTQNFCVTDSNKNLQKTKFKSFKCLNCMFTTASETQFLNHNDICDNISKTSKFHQCHLCIKSFKNYSALNSHLKNHSYRSEIISRKKLVSLNKKKIKIQNKNTLIKSQKFVFPKIANFNRSHKCKDCNRHFTTRHKLNIHFKQHKKQMICNQCNKKFVLKKNFEKHLLSHMSNDTSFNKSNSLQNQRAIKKSIKPKSVSNSETQNVSETEKSFQCSFCNNYCKSKQSLSQHKRHHHSTIKHTYRKLKSKTVECKWCSIIITKCNLLRHIKCLHPNINPIKCSHCPMAFKDSASLKLHVFECHTN
ncbi:zinc finger protein 626-like [Rhopalosiphum maidis]|uniref:zinc finger protein 626-like n=1 Tax=Rhopalosiphum maidis TaxID=43146 RepID=UPI000F00D812|nr:zinc finger protein 626-like [Rhopalosiphum maidis]XP_026822991.1 zinc finger protein 626-like [Rhopalosiphum maidis]XP_026822992.1 zinc finger protein 626-like [Rhopalosiphum maidis]